MKLTDLKRTKADRKAAEKDMKASPVAGDDYPYGTRISLGEDEIGKLGLTDLPKAGQKMHLRAHAVVHSVSHDERAGGKPHRRLELQIHRMALEKRGNADSMEDAVDQGVDEADRNAK